MKLLDAQRELADILARIRLGRFVPPQASRKGKGTEPDRFVNAASRFLKAKRREGLKPTSLDSLRWALDTHLLPFFGRDRLRTIDVERVEAYLEHELGRRDEIAVLSEHGSYLEGPSGGAMRPMSNRSINTTLEILTQLLDWTAARGLGPEGQNPAAGLRLRASARTNFALELDELDDLIAAAGHQHAQSRSDRSQQLGQRATALRAEGKTWKQVGAALGVAESTALYHSQKHEEEIAGSIEDPVAIQTLAERALICLLAFSGARVTELCRLTLGDVDLGRQRLRIADSKTPSGIREVHLSPRLVQEIGTYLAARGETAGDALLLPSPTGRRPHWTEA